MLFLRTGGNGSGKSLLTLKDIRELQESTGRPVCYNLRPADDPKHPNTPYCNIKPAKAAEFGWKGIHFKDWQEQTDGTIFLIDECHYDLPQRPSSQFPPPHVAKLTEHRSRGFDFYLLTQHPGNIDTFVRKLVQAPGWHEHIKRLGGALPVANVIRWDAVNLQCEQAGSGKSGEIKTRGYPTEVYDWYESATLHTGRKRIPKQVWILLACVLLVPLLFWYGISQTKKIGNAKGADKAAEVSAVSSGGGGAAAARPRTPAEYVDAYRPRLTGWMHTAPVYDDLAKPVRVPVPAACVDMPSVGCKCYTQDSTPYPLDAASCRSLVAHGVFLAFNPEGQQTEQARPAPVVEARRGGQIEPQAPNGLAVIGTLPQATKPVPAIAPPVEPQRIASVKR